MQHRGGSRCYLDLGFIGHGMAVPPVGHALKLQARQSGRNFAPGEAMIYNNGGYHLVSIAIERVGGAPFEEQLKARLFDVVGMPDTASIPTDYVITPGIADDAHARADGDLAARPLPLRGGARRGRDGLDRRRHAALDGAPARPRPLRLARQLGGADRAAALRRRLAGRLRARPACSTSTGA